MNHYIVLITWDYIRKRVQLSVRSQIFIQIDLFTYHHSLTWISLRYSDFLLPFEMTSSWLPLHLARSGSVFNCSDKKVKHQPKALHPFAWPLQCETLDKIRSNHSITLRPGSNVTHKDQTTFPVNGWCGWKLKIIWPNKELLHRLRACRLQRLRPSGGVSHLQTSASLVVEYNRWGMDRHGMVFSYEYIILQNIIIQFHIYI